MTFVNQELSELNVWAMEAAQSVSSWKNCNHESRRKRVELEVLQLRKQQKACQIGRIATMKAAESVSNWKHCNHESIRTRVKLELLQP